jgi:predicted nucleotidyltransferase
MTAKDSLRTRLAAVAEALGDVARGTRWYLFGSHVRGTVSGDSDVDLLVVYDSDSVADAKRLITAIWDFPMPQPLDLIVLSRAEEQEMNFVAKEGAELICER